MAGFFKLPVLPPFLAADDFDMIATRPGGNLDRCIRGTVVVQHHLVTKLQIVRNRIADDQRFISNSGDTN